MIKRASALIVALCAVGCQQSAPSLHWDLDSSRDIRYLAHHDVGLQSNGQPEFSFDQDMTISFDSRTRAATIEEGGSAYGPFPTSRGGHLTVTPQTAPSHTVMVLLHILPENGVTVSTGDRWTTYHPPISQVVNEDALVSAQDRVMVKVTGIRRSGRNVLVDLEFDADVRIVRNSAFNELFANLSPSAQQDALRMTAFMPNLKGKATFDSTSHQIETAEFEVLLMPRLDVSRSQLSTNPHRRKVTVAPR